MALGGRGRAVAETWRRVGDLRSRAPPGPCDRGTVGARGGWTGAGCGLAYGPLEPSRAECLHRVWRFLRLRRFPRRCCLARTASTGRGIDSRVPSMLLRQSVHRASERRSGASPRDAWDEMNHRASRAAPTNVERGQAKPIERTIDQARETTTSRPSLRAGSLRGLQPASRVNAARLIPPAWRPRRKPLP